jgi:hypothetical protein
MIENLRRLNVHTDQPHFDRVKVDDWIKVSYRGVSILELFGPRRSISMLGKG